ncbi:MAG: LysR substrate-binding domain-containing protein [Tunicatimonas sp.]
MTITQLEYVVALDTHRNFATAAAHCHVTQPTLSMQLKKLEEELGTILFDRNKKPVAPTDVGEQVIEQARVSLQSLKQIDALVRRHSDDLSGTLRVGIIPTLSPYLLPRVLPALAKQYPNLTLEIEELLSDQIIDKLHKDQLDVALWVARESENRLVHVPLFYERFLVYLPDDHVYPDQSIALSELDMKQLWLLKEGHCFRDQVASFCGGLLETSHHANFLSGSLETLKKIVDQHYGFTLLPELAVLDLPEAQRKNVRSFKNISPLRAVSLTYHRRFCKDKLVQMLRTEVRANIPQTLLEEGRGQVVRWK